MEDAIGLILVFGGSLFFLGLGFFVGGWTERSHFRRIEVREQEMSDILVTQMKSFPGTVPGNKPPSLVVAEAVIATDYLKNFLAGLRKIFGGEMRSYQTLLTRARSEALLRLMEQARDQGYNALCNVRFENADVGGTTTTKKVAMVAILASGTAYYSEQA